MSSIGVSLSWRPSSRRKLTAKFTPTMPPVSPIAFNCSSVRLRECGLSAWALECGGDQRRIAELGDVPEAAFV